MASRYYRPELDALRFFAFVCVFCHHLRIDARWFQPIRETGAFGMCMFFMLSAYLIVTILLREREATGTVSLSAFAKRRVLRIWPLYFLVLFGLYFFSRHGVRGLNMNGRIALAFSFLLGNVYILRHGWIGPVDPLWSLSVEEQFYVAVPAIVRWGGKRAVALIGAVTIALAYAVLVWLGLHATNSMVVWVNSFVQFQFFAAGGLTALWSNSQRPASTLKWRGVQLAIGLAFWVQAAKLYPLHTLKQTALAPLITAYLLMLLGTFLILRAVIDVELRIPAILIYLGKISYGLYMFHALVLWLLYDTARQWPRMAYFPHHPLITIPLAFGLTVAISALSYHFFERPILKFKERFETIHTRPA